MFKKAASIIICLLSTLECNSQNDSLANFERFLISATIGTAAPYKGFSLYHGDINAGPPERGICYRGEFTYCPWKVFGLTSSFVRTLNETPALSGYEFYPKSGLGAGPNIGKQISSFYYWAGNWITDNALVGVSGQYSFWKVKIRIKTAIGWQQVKTPEVRISAEGWEWSTTSGQVWWTRSTVDEPMTGRSLVYNYGIDLRTNIVGRFGVLVSIDFLRSVVDFKNANGTVQKNIFYRTGAFGLTYSIK